MTTGAFGTQLDTMQAAAGHVDQVNSQIQEQLRSLMSRLEPLAGTWKGQAATTFTALHQRWNDDAQRLSQALQGIGESLATNRSTYAQHEETNQQSFSKITQALG